MDRPAVYRSRVGSAVRLLRRLSWSCAVSRRQRGCTPWPPSPSFSACRRRLRSALAALAFPAGDVPPHFSRPGAGRAGVGTGQSTTPITLWAFIGVEGAVVALRAGAAQARRWPRRRCWRCCRPSRRNPLVSPLLSLGVVLAQRTGRMPPTRRWRGTDLARPTGSWGRLPSPPGSSDSLRRCAALISAGPSWPREAPFLAATHSSLPAPVCPSVIATTPPPPHCG